MIARLNRNRYILLIDVIFIIITAPLSFLVRLDASPLFIQFFPALIIFMLVSLVVKPFLYWAFGLYRQFWRYASISELKLIVIAVTVSSLVLTALLIAIALPYGLLKSFPRSVLVIDWLLQLIFVGGIRLLVRISGENARTEEIPEQSAGYKRVLIAGAGDAGSMMVREIQHNPGLDILPIAFVDDDPDKIGKRIHNLPVLGKLSDIPDLAKKWYIQEVIIAMPTAPGRVIREITQACEKANIPSKIMPGMYELLSGQVSVSQIREVQIEDLLRREPVEVDESGISSYLQGKCVLITGAGGSIGSELTRQVARYSPASLILLGHGENSIYTIAQEMQNTFIDLDVQACISDIRDAARIESLFNIYQPDVVFHAAAHKHVPLMEANICEAVSNNILGTQVVLNAAHQANVKRFVLISSDKAVNPLNIMGTTKRVSELLVQNIARQFQRNFVAVRFGNVLGSRGSVVPLFKQQIAGGGPLTITHRDMERFFMTIPEAVHLVIQAGALGQGGEIFVLDMGQPVKIIDLARDLIELSGLKLNEDIEIVFTGLRPGEKLSERLFSANETVQPTTHPKIVAIVSPPDHQGLSLQQGIQDLQAVVAKQDEAKIHKILSNLLTSPNLQKTVSSTQLISKTH